ncbi:MAG: radical SAM protein [bacterium]
MEQISRKTLLYKTQVEYGDYTINHVFGCHHGCKYPCYAMMLAKRFGKIKTYDEWCKPKIVSNALEILHKEIPKLKDKIKSVHLCFTTDPFMYNFPEVTEMSIQIIKALNEAGIQCTALTKGILPKELSELSFKNEYGITLISLNETFLKIIEPNAAPYIDRISSLRKLHELGCKTWVRIEPYPTPNIINQEYFQILESISFVDKIIFGRLNYNKEVTRFPKYKSFFNKLAIQTIDYCKEHNIQYHIKKGTITRMDKL